MERKEAIEIIKKNWPDSSFTMLREALETLIPELKESKDEKIRKWLVNYFREVCNNVAEKEKNAVLAWLEKQGEQKSNIVPIFKVGDIIKNKKNDDTVKVEQILIDSYCYSGWDGAATIHSDFLISDQGNWELVEQKPAWSEEDEQNYDILLKIICSSNKSESLVNKLFDWFKSLKGRIRPKQEWSKKDETMLNCCLGAINTTDYFDEDNKDKMKNWLESLRPQSHWKPSDDQIRRLEYFLKLWGKTDDIENIKVFETVKSLLNDLKKLREE